MVLLIAACRLVDVQVGAPTIEPIPTLTPPAPTAIVLPTDPPPTLIPSRRATDYRDWDDDTVVVQTVAYPHIVFEPDDIRIELMEQGEAPTQYLALSAGLGLRMRADWRMLWTADAYGIGSVTVDAYVQTPNADDYEQWESASTEDIEGWGSSFRNELLDVTLWPSEPGTYQLRSIVGVHAYVNDDWQDSRESTFEMEVVVLSGGQDELPESETDFAPAFGDLEEKGVLLDWRAWNFGPCAVESDDQALTRLMDAACSAIDNGNLSEAETVLQNALDAVADDAYLTAFVREQLGVVSSAQLHWNSAARHFREALDLWQAQDDAFRVSTALHNLGNALLLSGRWDEGINELVQAGSLRDQIGDYGGSSLTWGQLGFYWRSTDMMRENAQELSDIGAPQADPLWAAAEAQDAESDAEAADES